MVRMARGTSAPWHGQGEGAHGEENEAHAKEQHRGVSQITGPPGEGAQDFEVELAVIDITESSGHETGEKVEEAEDGRYQEADKFPPQDGLPSALEAGGQDHGADHGMKGNKKPE